MDLNTSLLQSGGLLMAGGFLMSYLRSIPTTLWGFFLRWFSVRSESPDHENTYHWVKAMVAEMTPIGGHRDVTLYHRDNNWDVSPAPGIHYYWYKGHIVQATRYRKELENRASNSSQSTYENISIRIFFASMSLLTGFLSEAKTKYEDRSREDLYVNIFNGSHYNSYVRELRDINSVTFAPGVKESLVGDIQEFISTKVWYQKLGIPYRRGFLLHGKPGNGKTSLIKAVASMLRRPICIISLNQKDLDDVKLQYAFNVLSDDAIVVIEDGDCLFAKREASQSKVSFSGLLNALDGLASKEGYIFFMTTNHIDQLDPALIRPGRIDRQIEITNAVRPQVVEYFNKFFGLGHEDLALRFGDKFTEEPSQYPMAAVQNHLLTFKNNPELAVTSPIL